MVIHFVNGSALRTSKRLEPPALRQIPIRSKRHAYNQRGRGTIPGASQRTRGFRVEKSYVAMIQRFLPAAKIDDKGTSYHVDHLVTLVDLWLERRDVAIRKELCETRSKTPVWHEDAEALGNMGRISRSRLRKSYPVLTPLDAKEAVSFWLEEKREVFVERKSKARQIAQRGNHSAGFQL